jgi:[histone H4]-lysine20 N-methyltransferase SETD8
MERNVAKNVQEWQSKKDTAGKPEINAEKDNLACQATNVKAVPRGVKRKLFCSSKSECPKDSSLYENFDSREKTVQTSDEKLRQPSKRRKKNASKTIKFKNVSFTLWEDLRPTGSRLFPVPKIGMDLLEEALVEGPKLDVKFQPLQWEDFVTFGDQGWITDDCIGYYLRMIVAEDTKLKVEYIVGTFYAAYLKNGYAAVSQQLTPNFLDSDLVFFPINIPCHWILGVVDVKRKYIYILDSMYSKEKESLYEAKFREIRTFCTYHFQERTGMKLSENYFKYLPQSNTGMGVPVPPQQNNNFDCGIFVILACLFISHGLPLSYKQEEIRYFRNRLAIEVLGGSLFPLYEEEIVDDSLEDPHYAFSSFSESDSEQNELPASKCERPKRRVSSELKKIEAEHLSFLLQSTDETKLGLEVRETSDGRGRGVFTQTDRSRKSFICEYAGDTVTKEVADRRVDEYEQQGAKNFYQYYFSFKNQKMCVDAQVDSGRIGRLFNHSKNSPNCIAKLIEIENSPRIVLFALKDISKGAELLFDYGDRRKASILAHPWLAL